jgi:hypothetical protein
MMDAYRFAQDRNPAFVQSNLGDWRVLEKNSHLNLCIIVARDGQILYSGSYDSDLGGPVSLTAFAGEHPAILDLLQPTLTQEQALAGLLRTERGLLLLVARPILTTHAGHRAGARAAGLRPLPGRASGAGAGRADAGGVCSVPHGRLPPGGGRTSAPGEPGPGRTGAAAGASGARVRLRSAPRFGGPAGRPVADSDPAGDLGHGATHQPDFDGDAGTGRPGAHPGRDPIFHPARALRGCGHGCGRLGNRRSGGANRTGPDRRPALGTASDRFADPRQPRGPGSRRRPHPAVGPLPVRAGGATAAGGSTGGGADHRAASERSQVPPHRRKRSTRLASLLSGG